MIFLTLWLQSSDLRRNIDNLEKNSVTSLGTPVNLGSEVYMQADIPDTKRIFVDIGLGFHVEFTWSETINYISQREEKLSRQTEEYTRLIASINARSSWYVPSSLSSLLCCFSAYIYCKSRRLLKLTICVYKSCNDP
ncbi:Protein UXT-like protein [Morus notabilis]|uniref:Protein UXT-like protein n=1 Tax=Morus notabilis TaxID=981085 RepID=W9R9K0_9ROSA|nr:Protein UXT-like protein [Morus notabilis]